MCTWSKQKKGNYIRVLFQSSAHENLFIVINSKKHAGLDFEQNDRDGKKNVHCPFYSDNGNLEYLLFVDCWI